MTHGWVLAGVAVLTLSAGTPVRGWVTVLGGGLAEDCSKAAMKDLPAQDDPALCTQALENKDLDIYDTAATYVNRGVIRLRLGDFAQAGEDFDVAVRTKPDLAEAYVNRGAVSLAQRRYADGLADTNRALKLGVREPEKAYYNRAIAYEAMNQMKAAYLDYQMALQLKPDWEDPKRQLARFTVSRKLGS